MKPTKAKDFERAFYIAVNENNQLRDMLTKAKREEQERITKKKKMGNVLFQKDFIKGDQYHTDNIYECGIERYFHKKDDDELSDNEICDKSIRIIIKHLGSEK